jgi:hypothetical protein
MRTIATWKRGHLDKRQWTRYRILLWYAIFGSCDQIEYNWLRLCQSLVCFRCPHLMKIINSKTSLQIMPLITKLSSKTIAFFILYIGIWMFVICNYFEIGVNANGIYVKIFSGLAHIWQCQPFTNPSQDDAYCLHGKQICANTCVNKIADNKCQFRPYWRRF